MQPRNFIQKTNAPQKNPYVADDSFDYFKTSFYSESPKIGFEIGRGAVKDLASLKDIRAEVTLDKSASINIGDRTFSLPIRLKEIREEIESSMEIPKLEDNWDQEGAKKVEDSVYLSSIDFLVNYSTYIYNNSRIIIDAPEINPCADGSIDLSWRSAKLRLLINFKPSADGIKANFYGDLYDPAKSMQGYIDLTQFQNSFAEWMKQLEK